MLLPVYIALGLVAWTGLGIALVRRAERAAAAAPFPWGSTLVASGVAALAVVFRPPGWNAAACGLVCVGLVIAAEADMRTGYLFDAITFPSAVLSAALNVMAGTAADAAAGVVLLAGSFGAVVLVSRGRWMGLGDVKAMYAIGAAFGPLESMVAIFASCVSGIVSLALQSRLKRGAELRFGPHLAAGAAFALVAGAPIVHHVLGL